MATSKPTSETSKSPKRHTGRRTFIWKTGAVMSAVVASAVAGFSKSGADRGTGLQDQVDRLSRRLGGLEDANAIRRLHQGYESHLTEGAYEEVVGMFADDAEVVYNGGLFAGKEGIRRLYCDHFAPRLCGKKIEPAPGFELDAAQQQDIVEVAADRRTAAGRFPYSMQVGEPMTANSSLVDMARLQGEGIVKWWEGGRYEASYVKVGEGWKIKRLEYRAVSKADYKPGQMYAKPIDVPAFSSVFPKHPTGPDKLIAPKKA
jgi:hypothetical protein